MPFLQGGLFRFAPLKVTRLKDHLLGRLHSQPYDGDQEPYSDQDRMSVHIVDNRIYSLQLLRVNYTMYNIHRDQDSVNPRTHPDVMVLSHEDDPWAHPYWYTQVLGIFHLRVLHLDPSAMNCLVQHMEVLWVQWFGLVPGHQFGPKVTQLLKIGFIPDMDPLAFGFLDPSLVVCATHLIPAFNDGWTAKLLAASLTAGWPPGETVGEGGEDIGTRDVAGNGISESGELGAEGVSGEMGPGGEDGEE